jgi:hypothetical protein
MVQNGKSNHPKRDSSQRSRDAGQCSKGSILLPHQDHIVVVFWGPEHEHLHRPSRIFMRAFYSIFEADIPPRKKKYGSQFYICFLALKMSNSVFMNFPFLYMEFDPLVLYMLFLFPLCNHVLLYIRVYHMYSIHCWLINIFHNQIKISVGEPQALWLPVPP